MTAENWSVNFTLPLSIVNEWHSTGSILARPVARTSWIQCIMLVSDSGKLRTKTIVMLSFDYSPTFNNAHRMACGPISFRKFARIKWQLNDHFQLLFNVRSGNPLCTYLTDEYLKLRYVLMTNAFVKCHDYDNIINDKSYRWCWMFDVRLFCGIRIC